MLMNGYGMTMRTGRVCTAVLLAAMIAQPAAVLAEDSACARTAPPGGWPEPLDRGPPERGELLRAASLDMRFGDIDRAAAKYARVLEADPANRAALLGRAAVSMTKGDDASALDDLNKVYDSVRPFWHADEYCSEAELGRGAIALRKNDYSQALVQFTATIARDRTRYSAAYSGRAQAHLGLGMVNDALADAHRAIWVNAYDAAAYRIRSHVYAALSRSAESFEDASRAEALESFEEVTRLAYRTRAEKAEHFVGTEWLAPDLPGRPAVSHRYTLYPTSASQCLDGARQIVYISIANGVVVARPTYAGPDGEILAVHSSDGLVITLGNAGCRITLKMRKPVSLGSAGGQEDPPAAELVPLQTDRRFEHAIYSARDERDREQCETAAIVVRAYWGVVEISADTSISSLPPTFEDTVPRPIGFERFGRHGCEIELAFGKLD